MTLATESGERRRDKRYGLPKAIVSLPQLATLAIGTVVDISKGGLAVRYPDRGEQLAPVFEIDILLTSNSYFITSVPVVTISDYELENRAPLSLISERRCGLKFGELSRSQAAQVDQVVRKFTAPL